jgi:hypothetical protein
LARPLTLSTSGGCPEEGRRLPESSMAVVPTADSADQDVRVVRSRARGDIHLQKSQGSARPRFAPRKRREGRSSRCLRTPVKTRGECSGRPAGAARRDGLSQERPDRSPRDGRRLDLGEELPGIDVPRSEPGSGVRERDRLSASGPDAWKGRQRDRSTEHPVSRKSPGALPAGRASVQDGSRADRSRRARRQACSRWGPDDRKVVRRRILDGWWQHLPRGRPRSRTLAGLPTASGGSLQRWCRYRVLVT